MPIENADKPRRRNRAGMLVALAALVMVAGSPVGAAEPPIIIPDHEPVMTAAFGGLNGRLGRRVGLPDVLTGADAGRYRQAIELQDRGQWAAADRALASLTDDVLKGDVLARRYLHPAYRTSFTELRTWLDLYADHPEAPRLFRLANARRPAGGPAVKRPSNRYLAGTGIDTADSEANWEAASQEAAARLNAGQNSRVRGLSGKVRGLVAKGALAEAARMVGDPEAAKLLKDAHLDTLKAIVAAGYFAAGDDAPAFKWASQAAQRSGEHLPGAHWTAGLASWRMGEVDRARRHFEAVANTRDGSGWMISAGAYWAARANLAARRPEVVNHWLDIAASYPRTFYGLMARRALGYNVRFAWDASPLTDLDVDNLMRVPGGKRALALLQIGEKRRAEDELRKLYPTATPAVAQSMLAVAHAGDMPELALRLGGIVANRDGRHHDSAAYPLPAWTPQGGWSVDQALVLAIARQESAFNPQARSPAGAAGLMQLMPQTARFVAAQPVARERLHDPQYNLALGQRYIRHLLDHEAIRGNLFMLAAAYNGGPGNLIRWQKSIDYKDDPLLFIESIPSRETRIFVERVMTNFWIYRSRVGQPSPSLDALVAGDWPRYDPLDERQSAGLTSR